MVWAADKSYSLLHMAVCLRGERTLRAKLLPLHLDASSAPGTPLRSEGGASSGLVLEFLLGYSLFRNTVHP